MITTWIIQVVSEYSLFREGKWRERKLCTNLPTDNKWVTSLIALFAAYNIIFFTWFIDKKHTKIKDQHKSSNLWLRKTNGWKISMIREELDTAICAFVLLYLIESSSFYIWHSIVNFGLSVWDFGKVQECTQVNIDLSPSLPIWEVPPTNVQ